MRRSLVFLSLVGLFAATLVLAAEGQRYRIELADGRQVVASGAPVQRGSVVTFRPYPAGMLTGIPAEQVVRIERGEVATFPEQAPESTIDPGVVRPLEPGEALDVGLTGEGSASGAAQTPASGEIAANPQSAGVNPAYYGGYGGAVNPNGTLIGPDGLPRAASSTDLARAMAQTTTAPNGFPATSAPTMIGPNGTPTLAPGVAGSDFPVIGPNGTPVMSGTPQLTIGPNGTPVLAPGAAPIIGPNGTPVLAPSGQPGSAAPVVGPNGTPVLAPAGRPGSAAPSVAPNGFPSAPAPGH
jgi:hypothetical protein